MRKNLTEMVFILDLDLSMPVRQWRTGLFQGAGPLFFCYEVYNNTKGTA